MVLTENRTFLRSYSRDLLNKVTAKENEIRNFVQKEPSKKGSPTLKILLNDKVQYIHSKYDPEKEAATLLQQIKDMDQYAHVLFIGTGLGYHVMSLLNRFPNMKFSIYEPDVAVLYSFLSHVNLTELPASQLQRIFTTLDFKELEKEVQLLNQSVRGTTYIFALPVYEKLFAKEVNAVRNSFVKELKNKRSDVVTNVSFQKRWTVNSIKNSPKVLNSPNVLNDLDKNVFKGKPAIIVAAGPSLNEEFTRLKYIKDNGLAYIFSVGSSINALIENDIYPDAACTYDPSEKNQFVIQKIKDMNITEIPLIFGSSVGYETLENYPGKLLHMITSQDSVAPRLLDTHEELNTVLDASSIAVITFQLLTKLECSLVILVGQNLGFQNNARYATGIDYDFIDSKLSDAEIQNSEVVKDVYGNDIKTTEGFNRMRHQLEMYINKVTNTKVINTTKGGAHIEGAEFKPLSEVISAELTKEEVKQNWYETNKVYDKTYAEKQLRVLAIAKDNYSKILTDSLSELNNIDKLIKIGKLNNLEESFVKFDKKFKKIKRNPFYTTFIEPMMRVQNTLLAEASQEIRFEKDHALKGRAIVSEFGHFLKDSDRHLQFIIPYFKELNIQVTQKDVEVKNEFAKN